MAANGSNRCLLRVPYSKSTRTPPRTISLVNENRPLGYSFLLHPQADKPIATRAFLHHLRATSKYRFATPAMRASTPAACRPKNALTSIPSLVPRVTTTRARSIRTTPEGTTLSPLVARAKRIRTSTTHTCQRRRGTNPTGPRCVTPFRQGSRAATASSRCTTVSRM